MSRPLLPCICPTVVLLLLVGCRFNTCSANHAVTVAWLGMPYEINLDSVEGSKLEHISQTLITTIPWAAFKVSPPTRIEIWVSGGDQVLSDSQLVTEGGTQRLVAKEWWRYYAAVRGVGNDHLCSQSPVNASKWLLLWHEARINGVMDDFQQKITAAKHCEDLTEAELSTIDAGPISGAYAVKVFEGDDGSFTIPSPPGMHSGTDLVKFPTIGVYYIPDESQRRLGAVLQPMPMIMLP